MLAARFAVRGWLQADRQLGWIVVAKVALGLRLTAVAAGVSVWALAAAQDIRG